MPVNRRLWLRKSTLAALAAAAGAGTGPAQQVSTAASLSTGAVRRFLEEVVRQRRLPGAVWWVERQGLAASGHPGHRARQPALEPMQADTIFDVASLTKVVATTTAVMLLHEEGRLALDDRVCQHLPRFIGEGREFITIKQLLTHTSGLRPGIPLNPPWMGRDAGLDLVYATVPQHLPDAEFRYSDINFLLLGELIRQVAGAPLDEWVVARIFAPLKMHDTRFTPPPDWHPRIAPAEPDEHGMLLRGRVHDPTSRRMGGVTGHAGLFSTAPDLARYLRMLLHGGELEGTRVLRKETVDLMTSVQTPPAMPEQRGLGWDIHTAYSRPRGLLFPADSYGHTGFTGTCLWVDPATASFYIFLSSRLHAPRRGSDIRTIYERMGTLAAQVAGYAVAPGASL